MAAGTTAVIVEAASETTVCVVVFAAVAGEFGQTGEGFDFVLHREEGLVPVLDDLVHFLGRGGELLVLGVVVEDCVVGCEDGVLDFDLGGEEPREEGEDGCVQERELSL